MIGVWHSTSSTETGLTMFFCFVFFFVCLDIMYLSLLSSWKLVVVMHEGQQLVLCKHLDRLVGSKFEQSTHMMF